MTVRTFIAAAFSFSPSLLSFQVRPLVSERQTPLPSVAA
jgi:hypothetical protein